MENLIFGLGVMVIGLLVVFLGLIILIVFIKVLSFITDRTTGEKTTDFIDIVAWRQTAEFVSRYFTKGRLAVVEGRLQLRDWTDKDGNKRRAAEVVADNVYFGDSKRDAEAGGYVAPTGGYGAPGGYAPPAAPASNAYAAPAAGDQFAELSDDDGELPF